MALWPENQTCRLVYIPWIGPPLNYSITSSVVYRHDMHPVYNALKRASRLLEEAVVTTPLDDMDYSEGMDGGVAGGVVSQKEQYRLRPALLSVLAGVHWKRLVKKKSTYVYVCVCVEWARLLHVLN